VGNSRNGTQVSDEEAKGERQRALRNNKAWRAAETVRRQWLKASRHARHQQGCRRL